MNIIQSLDVQACPACLVVAELFEQLFVPPQACHQIDGEILFAWREADEEPITFSTALIHVMILAEADDACPPHPWLRFRTLLHQPDESEAILARLLVGDGVQEAFNVLVGAFGFEVGHGVSSSMPGVQYPTSKENKQVRNSSSFPQRLFLPRIYDEVTQSRVGNVVDLVLCLRR